MNCMEYLNETFKVRTWHSMAKPEATPSKTNIADQNVASLSNASPFSVKH
jgi:hypothetical protein